MNLQLSSYTDLPLIHVVVNRWTKYSKWPVGAVTMRWPLFTIKVNLKLFSRSFKTPYQERLCFQPFHVNHSVVYCSQNSNILKHLWIHNMISWSYYPSQWSLTWLSQSTFIYIHPFKPFIQIYTLPHSYSRFI